nr:hypothetical protein [Novosphingobium sp. FKTRR1]
MNRAIKAFSTSESRDKRFACHWDFARIVDHQGISDIKGHCPATCEARTDRGLIFPAALREPLRDGLFRSANADNLE